MSEVEADLNLDWRIYFKTQVHTSKNKNRLLQTVLQTIKYLYRGNGMRQEDPIERC